MRSISLKEAAALHDQGRYKEAEHLYIKLISQNPTEWELHFRLGTLYMQINKHGLAIPLLYRAIELNPKQFESLSNLGVCLRRENLPELALPILERANQLKPLEPEPLNNLGSLYINEGEPHKAEKWLRKAQRVAPEHSHVLWNLSLALLEQGKFEEGWQHYKLGRKTGDRVARWSTWPEFNRQKAKVVVYGEQGLGDEIMFASMFPDLIRDAEQVVIECHPRLLNLFKAAFPDAIVEPTRKDAQVKWNHEFDYQIASGELGCLYRNKASDFPKTPYLKANPELVKQMRARLEATGPGPYVGIGWRGGYKKTRIDQRSVDLGALGPVIYGAGTCVSLQYDLDADEEVKAFNAKNPSARVHHWPEIVRAEDYEITAALVEALDVVVSVNTSVIHLCGALGAKCWTLTPKKAAWRYHPYEGKMHWYGSVEMYPQHATGWEKTIAKVVQDLEELTAKKEAA